MNDNVSALIKTAEEAMAQYLGERGCFIYSATETFRNNPVLVYGINPGQDPELNPDHCSNPFLRNSIRDFRNQPNLIQTQVWLKASGREYDAPGLAPYQQRIRCILNNVGHCDALVTNLAFCQAPSESALLKSKGRDWLETHLDACWQVHEEILRVTQAKVVIALGDFTRQRLQRRFHSTVEETVRSGHVRSGHGDWSCYRDQGTWNGRPIHIFTLPHLSRYDPRPCVLEWLKDGIEAVKKNY